jgi:uncharacterized protein
LRAPQASPARRGQAAAVPLDGSWERRRRNPLGAGFSGVLMLGALYTTLGSLVLGVIMAVITAIDPSWVGSGDFLQTLGRYFGRFRVPILAVTAAAEIGIFLVLTFLVVRRWHSRKPALYLGYRPPAVVDLLLAGVGAVALVPLAALLDSWTYVVLPVLKELRGGQDSLLAIRGPLEGILVVFAVALVPAACEEALFRGWFLTTIRRRLSLPAAIAIQGVVFALFHGNPLSLVALTFVGCWLGWLFLRAGSLYASMTAHCLYNGTIIAVVNLRTPGLAEASTAVPWPLLAGALVLFAVAVMGIELRHRAGR